MSLIIENAIKIINDAKNHSYLSLPVGEKYKYHNYKNTCKFKPNSYYNLTKDNTNCFEIISALFNRIYIESNTMYFEHKLYDNYQNDIKKVNFSFEKIVDGIIVYNPHKIPNITSIYEKDLIPHMKKFKFKNSSLFLQKQKYVKLYADIASEYKNLYIHYRNNSEKLNKTSIIELRKIRSVNIETDNHTFIITYYLYPVTTYNNIYEYEIGKKNWKIIKPNDVSYNGYSQEHILKIIQIYQIDQNKNIIYNNFKDLHNGDTIEYNERDLNIIYVSNNEKDMIKHLNKLWVSELKI